MFSMLDATPGCECGVALLSILTSVLHQVPLTELISNSINIDSYMAI